MEADFQRFYQLNINEPAFQMQTSFRRFLVLLRGLPDGSAFFRFLRDRQRYSMALHNENEIGGI